MRSQQAHLRVKCVKLECASLPLSFASVILAVHKQSVMHALNCKLVFIIILFEFIIITINTLVCSTNIFMVYYTSSYIAVNELDVLHIPTQSHERAYL